MLLSGLVVMTAVGVACDLAEVITRRLSFKLFMLIVFFVQISEVLITDVMPTVLWHISCPLYCFLPQLQFFKLLIDGVKIEVTLIVRGIPCPSLGISWWVHDCVMVLFCMHSCLCSLVWLILQTSYRPMTRVLVF